MRVRAGIEGQSLKHVTHKNREHIPLEPNNQRKEEREKRGIHNR